jgi:hypothetical protein
LLEYEEGGNSCAMNLYCLSINLLQGTNAFCKPQYFAFAIELFNAAISFLSNKKGRYTEYVFLER